MNWDEYFIEVADTIRRKSKDPSTKVGAVLIGPERQIISTGFNGFPRGISEIAAERWERPAKYGYVEHAERNTIYNAARHGIAIRGSTLYLVGMGPPTLPCIECTKAIIQSGVVRVVGAGFKPLTTGPNVPDWAADLEFSASLLREAGVDFEEVAYGG